MQHTAKREIESTPLAEIDEEMSLQVYCGKKKEKKPLCQKRLCVGCKKKRGQESAGGLDVTKQAFRCLVCTF